MPSIPSPLHSVLISKEGETSKVGKRASNILQLSQEHDELAAKLREMTERLEAAEKRRQALEARQNGASSPQYVAAPPPPSAFRSPGSSANPTPVRPSYGETGRRASGEYRYYSQMQQGPGTGIGGAQPRSTANRI